MLPKFFHPLARKPTPLQAYRQLLYAKDYSTLFFIGWPFAFGIQGIIYELFPDTSWFIKTSILFVVGFLIGLLALYAANRSRHSLPSPKQNLFYWVVTDIFFSVLSVFAIKSFGDIFFQYAETNPFNQWWVNLSIGLIAFCCILTAQNK
jgi:hypothetical protein